MLPVRVTAMDGCCHYFGRFLLPIPRINRPVLRVCCVVVREMPAAYQLGSRLANNRAVRLYSTTTVRLSASSSDICVMIVMMMMAPTQGIHNKFVSTTLIRFQSFIIIKIIEIKIET